MYAANMRPLGIGVGLAALVASLFIWLQATAGPPQPRHPTGQSCASCHVAGDDVTPENAKMLIASQERLCAECHPKAVQVSHPSGIRPMGPLPAQYPADWKGDLTCSTCHNVHGLEHGLMRGNLRGRNFCLACHNTAFFDRMRDQGVSVATGHLASGVKLDMAGTDIDPYTLQCMGCHAGSGDPNVAMAIDRNQILRHSGSSVNHPIGRKYSDTASFNRRYKPEAKVSQKLFLPDGRMSCVTCHTGYAKEHGKLRIGKQFSALCFECHNI